MARSTPSLQTTRVTVCGCAGTGDTEVTAEVLWGLKLTLLLPSADSGTCSLSDQRSSKTQAVLFQEQEQPNYTSCFISEGSC